MKYSYSTLCIALGFFLSAPLVHAATCISITDNAGDVTVQGTGGGVDQATQDAADILSVVAATTTQNWTFDLVTKAAFQASPDHVANLNLLVDADGVEQNNYSSASNERAGSDRFFVFISTSSSTSPWKVKQQVFSSSTHQWQSVVGGMSFSVDGTKIHLVIPTNELPVDAPGLHWRFVTNIGEIGKSYTRDSAPDRSDDPSQCGYMPYAAVTVSSTSGVPETSSAGPAWLSFVLVAVGAVAMGGAIVREYK